MRMHTIAPAPGAKTKAKRLGRGIGSGLGKTCGKGHKGQNARAGGGVRPGFEGGQMPLIRRLPKRGFTNNFKKEYVVLNLSDLDKLKDGAKVTFESLVEDGTIKQVSNAYGIKILAGGVLTKKLHITAAKFSESAAKAVTKAGGTIELAVTEGTKKPQEKTKKPATAVKAAKPSQTAKK